MGGIIDSVFDAVGMVADPVFDAAQPIVDAAEKVADKVVPYVPQIGFGAMMGNAIGGGLQNYGGTSGDYLSNELVDATTSGSEIPSGLSDFLNAEGGGNYIYGGIGNAPTSGSTPWFNPAPTGLSSGSSYANTLKGLMQAGTGLYAANQQSQSARDAAAQSGDAAKYATYMQNKMYDQNRADWEPWRQVGVSSLAKLASGNVLPQDPGYQFRFGEGQKAMERSAAARGGLQSGSALKAAQRYGQDFASNEYGNAFNRLASMANLGQTANQTNQSSGSTYAGNVGNLAMINAATQGNAGMVGANSRASAYQGIGNLLGQWWR